MQTPPTCGMMISEMIGFLTGQVLEIDAKHALILNGGLGYIIFMTEQGLSTLSINSEIKLWTELVVREDTLDLYGFTGKEELAYFKLLVTISGIGPKSALSILSLAPPSTLRQAIISEDTSYLTRVSGIGKKSADRIIIELRGKIDNLAEDDQGNQSFDNDVAEALLTLGYNLKDVREVFKNFPPELTSADERVKFAIKYIGSNKK